MKPLILTNIIFNKYIHTQDSIYDEDTVFLKQYFILSYYIFPSIMLQCKEDIYKEVYLVYS